MDLDDEELKVTRMMNGADRNSRIRIKKDIETGEYVRTKNGKIGVFDRYSSRKENSLYKSPFNCFIKIKNRKTSLQCCEDFIVKHSKQLIDLIEVGDYVNGKYVKEIKGYENGKSILALIGIIEEQDIQTILTKESYMANCYKVGGEDEC